jgi:hypothetical protein
MDSALNAALNQPGWEKTFAMAVLHADTTIRKFIWRGFRPRSTGKNEITVGDKSAADFVQEAIKKQSDTTGIVDYAQIEDEHGESSDPIATATSFELTPEEKVKHTELLEDQRRCFRQIRDSFDGDAAMQEYLDALAEGIFKRAEISELTGLEPTVIDELRRKMIKHARKLFGVSDFEELQRRLKEGGL